MKHARCRLALAMILRYEMNYRTTPLVFLTSLTLSSRGVVNRAMRAASLNRAYHLARF